MPSKVVIDRSEMDVDTLRKARVDRVALLHTKSMVTPLKLFQQPAAGASNLLQTGKFSDFTIKCGDMAFKVHKAHIYMQSKYFESLIDAGFQESVENVVTIEDTEPVTMAMLLVLIYVGDEGQYLDRVYTLWPHLNQTSYPDTSAEDKKKLPSEHFQVELKTLTSVYALADRLLIDHICQAVAVYFKQILEAWLAPDLDPDLQFLLQADGQRLASVLSHIYDCTGPDDVRLREEATLICFARRRQLSLHTDARTVVADRDGRAWRTAERVAIDLKARHDALISSSMQTFLRNRYLDGGAWMGFLDHELWKL